MFDFCKIKNSSESSTELIFYGDIVSSEWDKWSPEDMTPLNVKQLADEIGDKDINIHINSGGGDCFAGFAIFNILKGLKGKKIVYIDGIAASIASVIAMVGDEIIMPKNSIMMIHKPWGSHIGNADDFRKYADILDKIESGIVSAYMEKASENVTEDNLYDKMRSEEWMTANKAAEFFRNIEVQEPVMAAASLSTRFFDSYKNKPRVYKQIEADPPGDPDMSEFESYLNLTENIYSKLN